MRRGRGSSCKERRNKRKRQELLSTLANILADAVQGNRSRPLAQLALSLDPLDLLVRWRWRCA